jgi:hypothetical protein
VTTLARRRRPRAPSLATRVPIPYAARVRFLWALGAFAVAVTVAVACYDPTIPDCVLVCAGAEDCPSGTECSSNGRCARPSALASCLVIDAPPGAPDAPVVDDAAIADASPLDAPFDASPIDGRLPDASVDAGACPARCTSCMNGACVIECENGACDGRVVCPPGMPCLVICRGNSCTGDIDCRAGSRCIVRCQGNNSCRGLISCGAGECDVTCGGTNSCTALIDCSNSCSCDVECTGNNACGAGSSCPRSDTCSSGQGCDDTLPSCSSC